MIKAKRKAEYLSLGGAKCYSFKEKKFFNLRKTILPICYNKTRNTILKTKGNPGKFPSVIRTATQQVQLCLRLSVTVFHKHKYLFTALGKHDFCVVSNRVHTT